MNVSRIAAVGLVAATLSIGGLVGCGSSDSSSAGSDTAAAADTTSTTAALSTDEFTAAAKAICTDSGAEALKIVASAENSLEGIQSLTADTHAVSAAALAKLQALTPPADLASNYEAYLAAQEANVNQAADVANQVKDAGTIEEANAILVEGKASSDELGKAASDAATAAGIPDCATAG